jgi:hypothetical protein
MQVPGAFMAIAGSCFLALVFLRAILHKIGGYGEFVGIVRDYRLLPARLEVVAAPLLLACECLVVAGLVLPQTRAGAAALAAGLLLAYALAIGLNLLRGRTTIDCGCGGGGQGISGLHLVRNALLSLFTLPAMLWPAAALSPAGFAAAAASVTVLWLTFLAFDQLLGNHTHARQTAFSRL